MNFLKETKMAIKDSGHKIKDVMFIGSSDGKYRLDFNAFAKIANFDYDSGFGSQEIARDLIIYFNDKTYLVRGEYDGSEWWEYNKPLHYKMEDKHKSYKRLTGGMWEGLKQMNCPPRD